MRRHQLSAIQHGILIDMEVAHYYKLLLTKEQKQVVYDWLKSNRRQHKWELSERFDCYCFGSTRVDVCLLNVRIVLVAEIYWKFLEFRVQTRNGREDTEKALARFTSEIGTATVLAGPDLRVAALSLVNIHAT